MSEADTKSRPTRQEEVKTQRRRRETLGADRSLKLHVPENEKDANFHYRWVNNKPGRIRQFTVDDDYDVVSSGAVESNSVGTTVSRIVSPNGDDAVLLRKRNEHFEDDQKQKQAVIDAREKSMKRAAPESSEGLSGPHAYVPGGSNRIGR